jgi:hypothetical protein
MAGFEIVVRPVVFPNLRPAPARSLPPPDDPEKGFAVIRGNGAKSVSLSYSYSASWSKSRPTEMERRSDEVTVYQEEDDGTVNKDNYVKMKVANRIKMRRENDPYEKKDGSTGLPPGRLGINETSYYQRVKPSNNVEVTRTDIVDKADSGGGE